MKFLVVDDDPVTQQIICSMLERMGYATLCAADGHEAVNVCRETPPAAVLMDLKMPGMDGLAAMRELRRLQREEGIPRFSLIVVSGSHAPADRQACLDAGADGFIAKPVMMAKLGSEIFRVLSLKQSLTLPRRPDDERR